jgi:hypothetical protein
MELQHVEAQWVGTYNFRVFAFWARRRLIRNLKELVKQSSTMTSYFPIYADRERTLEDNLNEDEFEELMQYALSKDLVQFRPAVPPDPETRASMPYLLPVETVQHALMYWQLYLRFWFGLSFADQIPGSHPSMAGDGSIVVGMGDQLASGAQPMPTSKPSLSNGQETDVEG